MAQMKAWAPWQRQKSSRSSCRWTTTRLTAETPTAWHSSCAGGWRALAQFVRTLGSRSGRRRARLRPQVEQRVERGGRRRARHARVVGRRVDDLAVLADVGRQDGHCAGPRQRVEESYCRSCFLRSSQFRIHVKRHSSLGGTWPPPRSARPAHSARCECDVQRPLRRHALCCGPSASPTSSPTRHWTPHGACLRAVLPFCVAGGTFSSQVTGCGRRRALSEPPLSSSAPCQGPAASSRSQRRR